MPTEPEDSGKLKAAGGENDDDDLCLNALVGRHQSTRKTSSERANSKSDKSLGKGGLSDKKTVEVVTTDLPPEQCVGNKPPKKARKSNRGSAFKNALTRFLEAGRAKDSEITTVKREVDSGLEGQVKSEGRALDERQKRGGVNIKVEGIGENDAGGVNIKVEGSGDNNGLKPSPDHF